MRGTPGTVLAVSSTTITFLEATVGVSSRGLGTVWAGLGTVGAGPGGVDGIGLSTSSSQGGTGGRENALVGGVDGGVDSGKAAESSLSYWLGDAATARRGFTMVFLVLVFFVLTRLRSRWGDTTQ